MNSVVAAHVIQCSTIPITRGVVFVCSERRLMSLLPLKTTKMSAQIKLLTMPLSRTQAVGGGDFCIPFHSQCWAPPPSSGFDQKAQLIDLYSGFVCPWLHSLWKESLRTSRFPYRFCQRVCVCVWVSLLLFGWALPRTDRRQSSGCLTCCDRWSSF